MMEVMDSASFEIRLAAVVVVVGLDLRLGAGCFCYK